MSNEWMREAKYILINNDILNEDNKEEGRGNNRVSL
jgi:hypothetical protein